MGVMDRQTALSELFRSSRPHTGMHPASVRWVLGESKASALRGESMQDVIFNGAGDRKPVGRASVELVFDNSDGRIGGQWGHYAELAAAGRFHIPAARTFALEDWREALEISLAGRARGKLVLLPGNR